MRLIYLSHPVRGDVQANLARVKRWLRWAYATTSGCGFVADWLLAVEAMGEDETHRSRGLAFDQRLIGRCDEFWLVGGRISAGMALELHVARCCGLTVRDLTHLGAEPPALTPEECDETQPDVAEVLS